VFHWVIDFPLFERDETVGVDIPHHPFTAAIAGEEEKITTDPGNVIGQHYDLIWNGWELGSGSIRIHDAELQSAVFTTMGLGEGGAGREVRLPARTRSGWARRPTGVRHGIERFVALMAVRARHRQVIAFPKVASAPTR